MNSGVFTYHGNQIQAIHRSMADCVSLSEALNPSTEVGCREEEEGGGSCGKGSRGTIYILSRGTNLLYIIVIYNMLYYRHWGALLASGIWGPG